MKKGFTLIELLAVIVILAIIALIATPIILGIIEDAKNNAKIRSAKFYIDAVEQAIVRYKMTKNTSFSPTRCEINNGNLYCDGSSTPLIVDIDGEKPKDGTIIDLKDGIVSKNGETIIKLDGAIIKFDEREQFILIEPICTLESGSEYAVGSKYICNPGDGNKTFYLVESSENYVSNSTLKEGEFALILSENIDNTTMSWCDINLSSLCPNGGSVELFDDKIDQWTNDQIIRIQLPSSIQVSNNFDDTSFDVAEWLNGYYWLSDSWVDELDSKSHGLVINGRETLDVYLEDSGYGLRPMIIVSKINLG